ncbi:MAG: DUF1642 domain-containing protein [Streptococcaceae bacterium]|jgi:hypothetical protein|nr:DUF1642 domain-containing protein [Streptococcaceae bacterium]MCH4176214.1 DUF1642 domain-containing protein [Streptococcaceae bacterium]
MSELSKEELIEKLNIHLTGCPSDQWYKGYNTAIQNAIALAKKLHDTPKKVLVPKYVADWFDKNKISLELKIWRYINEWDYHDSDSDFFKFMSDNNGTNPIETLIKMKLYGYEVEQPKQYVISLNNGEGYFHSWNPNNPFVVYPVKSNCSCYQFTDKRKADLVAELIGGEVEEVSNE